MAKSNVGKMRHVEFITSRKLQTQLVEFNVYSVIFLPMYTGSLLFE
jgi:hypothetical protein